MCYLIAKDVDKVGCVAVEMTIGNHLVSFKRKLLSEIDADCYSHADKIQLVTISRPSAYGEYEPYYFTDTESEFENAVKMLAE